MNQLATSPNTFTNLVPDGWKLQPYTGSANGHSQFSVNTLKRVSRGDQVRRLCVAATSPHGGGKLRRVYLVVLRGDYPMILTGEKTRMVECAVGDEARAVRELLLEAPAL